MDRRGEGSRDHRGALLWIDSSLGSLKTESARQLAEAALSMTSLEWQQAYLA
ncbi:hypothetical protein [Kitasatospora sp. NPDC088264]|uniref:hypothetical protein n=1 Tax=unclassified Kitasatospora TaxID=2633591 RepID=UPI0034469A33